MTNEKGEFRLDQLYPATYQLVVSGESFCTKLVNDIAVQPDLKTQVGTIHVTQGCIVTGIARLDGVPSGQVNIKVSAVPDEKNPSHFSTEAVTDNEGKFLLNKRLPAGRYHVMAAENIQANPLLMFVQYNKSKREFVVRPGSKSHVLDVPIQKVK